jgi:hypothetical protein
MSVVQVGRACDMLPTVHPKAVPRLSGEYRAFPVLLGLSSVGNRMSDSQSLLSRMSAHPGREPFAGRCNRPASY